MDFGPAAAKPPTASFGHPHLFAAGVAVEIAASSAESATSLLDEPHVARRIAIGQHYFVLGEREERRDPTNTGVAVFPVVAT